MKVKTDVKAGLIVGIGNVVGANGIGNSTSGGNLGSNTQSGAGTQIIIL